ncbi:MAG: rRNA maturation RNase YbeY [Candidimonas sp.]
MKPELTLAVQYGQAAPELPRWRLRRWVRLAVDGIALAMRDADPLALPDARAFERVALTVRLVDAEEGRELNKAYRNHDYATNVLTFEYGVNPDGTANGDIVLCVPVLRREAGDQGKTLLDHAAHLTIHGVLHALGYDHLDADDALRMETLETRLLRRIGIADPYAG